MSTNREPQPGSSEGLSANPMNPLARPQVHLGASLKIKGEISGNEDLRLDSQFEGSISLGGFRLTIGPSSRVDGEIVAREVVVLGEVNGNISARDKLEIKK